MTGIKYIVSCAEGVQCPRCWHYHTVTENFDNLCDRCQRIILEHFPNHASAPLIREALQKQRAKYFNASSSVASPASQIPTRDAKG